MRKLNSTMVIISWVITAIFTVLFFIRLAYFLENYGNAQFLVIFPYVLGMLVGNAIIPSVFWLITYLTAPRATSSTANGSSGKNQPGGYKNEYDGGHNRVESQFPSGKGGHQHLDGQYNSNELYK